MWVAKVQENTVDEVVAEQKGTRRYDSGYGRNWSDVMIGILSILISAKAGGRVNGKNDLCGRG